MTPEQFDNWKDFAYRMARAGFDGITPARKTRIEDELDAFFSWRSRDDQETAEIVDWDSGPAFVCDSVQSALSRHDHSRYNDRTGIERDCGNKFYGQVSCCIRAGLDMASAPSAGVIGFTVGDLRRMYPEGNPPWVVADFEPKITDQTPDEAEVWL